MKKLIKQIGCIAGTAILMFCICFSFVGCDDKEKKYDVSIKIANNYGSTWIFTPDIDVFKYEFEYTGEEMRFWVDSYNLPKHPRWSKEWFAPPHSGGNGIYKSTLYCPPGGKNKESKGAVKERGEYIIRFEADSTSNIWNFRVARLYITVI